MVWTWIDTVLKVVLEYETPKIVHIKNRKVGFINRLLQCAIITYVIVWVIVLNKGYQDFSTINSSVTTKVKGIVVTNFSPQELDTDTPGVYNRVWDVADFVIPPQENGAFFVMTNGIITPNQTMGYCAESPFIADAVCNSSYNPCSHYIGTSLRNGNGIVTGECIRFDDSIKTCEINAWCPVERDTLPLRNQPLLKGTENFTVLIKNSVEFPLWGYRRRNILDSSNQNYLAECNYDESANAECPVFKLGTIVDLAQRNLTQNYSQLAVSGGIIAIIIHWECNFDFDLNYCLPSYEFRRLDDPEAKLAKGWNFRFAKYFDNDEKRTLYKAYGILFTVLVQGRGGKFSTIPLLMNLGSGLALLAIAVIICDIIVLYVLKKRDFYYEKKYLMVTDTHEDTDMLVPECHDDPVSDY